MSRANDQFSLNLQDADGQVPEPPELPVEDADSIFEVIGDGERMREWLENLDAEHLDGVQQINGDGRSRVLGENMAENLGMRNWISVMRSLEIQPHPFTGDPPHSILQHPGAFLDMIVHLNEVDRLRLEYQDFEGLPSTRRKMFKYLLHPDRPVDVDDIPSTGGTDAVVTGAPGSGKTTLMITLAVRIMEINNEAVVWRGSSSRTEWLPLAPWTRLCLPRGIDHEAVLAPPKDESLPVDVDFDPVDVNLEDVVSEVVYYDDLTDLNTNVLEEGGFHVVYPDPKFRECEEITRRADETTPLDYITAWEALEDDDLDASDVTPVKAWWYAWLIHHTAEGAQMPVSWFCDEVKNVFPNGARNEKTDIPKMIEAVSDKYIDMRRNGLSVYLIGHNRKKHVSHHIRHLMRWGITMNGKSNPVNEEALSGRAPMNRDIASELGIGQALVWTVSNQQFSLLPWDDINDEYKIPGKMKVTFPGVQEVKEAC